MDNFCRTGDVNFLYKLPKKVQLQFLLAATTILNLRVFGERMISVPKLVELNTEFFQNIKDKLTETFFYTPENKTAFSQKNLSHVAKNL